MRDKREHDRNLNHRAAYMHIFADLVTSVLAVAALFGGKFFGYPRLDSIAGFVGGLLILKWSASLLGAKKARECCHCH
jgi:Co/Zn/Cd efflux system component